MGSGGESPRWRLVLACVALMVWLNVAVIVSAPNGQLNLFVSRYGTIMERSGNYLNLMDCRILLKPSGFDPANGDRIQIQFASHSIQAKVGSVCVDVLTVYDGPDETAPVLYSGCGSVVTANLPRLRASGDSVYIKFTTDASTVAPGWQFHYQTDQYLWVPANPMTRPYLSSTSLTLYGVTTSTVANIVAVKFCGHTVPVGTVTISTYKIFIQAPVVPDGNCTVFVNTTIGHEMYAPIQLLSCQESFGVAGRLPLCSSDKCVSHHTFVSHNAAYTCASNITFGGTPATLAHYNSNATRDYYIQYLTSAAIVNWVAIGLTDIATEGDWKWSVGPDAGVLQWRQSTGSGTLPSWMVWNAGEPNNAGASGEDVAAINSASVLNDIPENMEYPYFLMWPHTFTTATCGSGVICAVQPRSCGAGGGALVSIIGYNLGNGSDITSVSLAGVSAIIRGQGPHWVVVHAGYQPNIAGRSGDVVVQSSSMGSRTLTNGFTYRSATIPAGTTQCYNGRCYEVIQNPGPTCWRMNEMFETAASRYRNGYPGFLGTLPSGNVINFYWSNFGQSVRTSGLQAADPNTFKWYAGPGAPISMYTVSPPVCLQDSCPWSGGFPSGGELNVEVISPGTLNDAVPETCTGGRILVEYEIPSTTPPCQPGSFNAGAACTLCPAGTYSTIVDAASCTACSPGTYSTAGMRECLPCPTSEGYNCTSTAGPLALCSPGTYANGTGCTPCPSGYYSLAGWTTCKQCPAGFTCADPLRTTACPIGFYSAAGSTACTPCPLDTYGTAVAATSVSWCASCPAATPRTSIMGCPGPASCFAPTVVAVNPSAGHQDGGYTVTITGNHFVLGQSDIVRANLGGISTTAVTFVSRTLVLAQAPPSPNTVTGVAATVTTVSIGVMSGPNFDYLPRPWINSVTPASSKQSGGVTITLDGADFGGTVSAVSICGVAATSVNKISTTRIEAVTGAFSGAQAGASCAIVVNTTGNAGNSGPTFTYSARPTPTALVPTQGPLVGGTLVTVTGVNLGSSAPDITAFSLAGVAVSGFTWISSTEVHVRAASTSTAGTGAVSVTSTSFDTGTGASYRYNSPPNVTSVVPSLSPLAGGNVVTLLGTNLGASTADVTLIVLGGTTAPAWTWQSATRIDVLTGAGGPYAGGVYISTVAYGTFNSSASAFTYVPGPIISAVTPPSGPRAGGYVVTITGSQFFSDLTSVQLHDVSASLTSVTFVSSTELRVLAPSRSAAGSGPVTVSCTTSGTGSGETFTYNPVPVLTGMTPAVGPLVGGTLALLAGTDLGNNDITAVTMGGVNVAGFTWITSTRVIVRTPSTTTAGSVAMQLTSTLFGTSDSTNGLFTYLSPPSPTACTPTWGPTAGGFIVTVTGTNLGLSLPDVLWVSLAGANVTGGTYLSSTRILVIAGAATSPTSGSVVVHSVGYGRGSGATFTYNAPPFITAVAPTRGPSAGGFVVTLSGSNLATSVPDVYTLRFAGHPVLGGTFLTTTRVLVLAGPGVAGDTGPITLGSTTFGLSNSSSFTYMAAPSFSSVAPNNGPLAGGQVVTLVGASLFSDITSISLAGVPVSLSTVTWISVSEVRVVSPSTSTTVSGPVSVTTTTSGTGSGQTYTYNPVPVLTGATPAVGPRVGGNVVTLTGTNMGNADVTSVLFGTAATTTVTWVSATRVLALAPAQSAAGAVSLQLVSTSFGSSAATGGLYTHLPSPAITSISSTQGPMAGGRTISLIGTNLGNNDITAVTFVGTAASTVTWVSATLVLAVTGASSDGTGNVVLVSTSYGTATFASYTYMLPPQISAISPSNGALAGGTTVTLTGQRLGVNDIVSVTFGASGASTTVNWISPTQLEVVTPAASAAGTVALTVTSVLYGSTTVANAYTFNPAPTISAVTPNIGPNLGGTAITLAGANLGVNDLVSLTICGTAATNVQWISATQVTAVTAPLADANGCTGSVSVASTSYGTATLTNGYTYRPRAVISSVTPLFVQDTTGGTVTLIGSNLGSGSDITQVLLCGQLVSSIVSQTATQVVVVAAPLSGTMSRFEAETRSSTFGVGVSPAGSFFYSITGGSGGAQQPAAISIEPQDGPLTGGTTVTVFGSNLGAAVEFVGLGGVQASIVSRLGTAIVVTAGATLSATSGPALVIAPTAGVSQTAASQSYTYNAAPVLSSVVPTAGPLQGGALLTLVGTALVPSAGGADTTLAVTVCGRAASVQSQSASQIVVRTPAGTNSGLCTVAMSSARTGSATLANAYRYNVPPSVTATSEDNGPLAGGLLVLLTGPLVGNGNDVYSVQFGGVAAPIQSQSATSVLVTTPAQSTSGVASVLVQSVAFGDSWLGGGFRYNPVGTISSVQPSQGPLAGTNLVTISGNNLGNGADITQVTLAGTSATLIRQTSTQVVVRAAAASAAGTGAVVVVSTHYGTTTLGDSYRYNPAGAVTGVTPTVGRCLGGEFVTITGSNLCDGTASDVLAVTLRGVPVRAIVAQSATRLIVVSEASTALVGVSGTVWIQSVNYGNTTSPMTVTFTYMPSFVLSSLNGSLLEEAAPTAVTVWLDAPPALSVQTAVLTNSARATVTPSELVFSPSNWNQPQTVWIQANPDFFDNGDVSCPLQLNSSVSADPNFAGLSASTAHTCIDNDVAGVWLSNSTATTSYLARTGGFVVIETLTTLPLGVRLTSEPLHNVTVTVDASSPRLAFAAPARPVTFVFTPSTWNVTQSVGLSLPSDGASTPMEWHTGTARADSADPLYNGSVTAAAVSSVRLLLVDVSVTGLLQVSLPSRNTSENGQDAVVYVMLNQPISSALTVRLYSSRPDEARPDIASLQLTAADLYELYAVTLVPQTDLVDDDDQLYALQVEYPTEVSGVTILVTQPVWLYNENVDRAGLVMSRSNLTVNETGTVDTVEVRLQSKPTSAVSVSVACNTTLVSCAPSNGFTFTAATWNTSQTITVTGLRNGFRGDATSPLVLSAAGADRKYNGMTRSTPVTNLDVYWPSSFTVVPELMPMAGLNASLTAVDLLQGASLFVNGLPAQNATFLNQTGSTTVLFFPPYRYSATGYANLTVINPDGGFGTAVDVMFFSEDCPQVGLIGRGSDCRQCPSGAICPGGNRIWPLPGWWTAGEFSGEVGQCLPAARCLGGRFSSCREGHTGSFCSLCIPGWYMDTNDLCAPCQASWYLAVLFLAQFSFLALFLVIIVLARESAIDKVEFVLLNLRVMWVVGAQTTSQLPEAVHQVFSILRLFVSDVSFVNPACSGLSTQASVFALNLSVALGAVLVLTAVAVIRTCAKASLTKRYIAMTSSAVEKDYAEVDRVAKHTITEQSLKGVFAISAFCFEVLLVKSIEGVYCVRVNGELRLVTELDQRCFEGSHVPMFMASVAVIFLLAVLFPVTALIGGRLINSRRSVPLLVHHAAMKTMDEYREEVWWWGATSLLAFEVPLILNSEVISHYRPDAALVLQMVILCVYLIGVIALRPFRMMVKNVGLVVVMLTSITATTSEMVAAYGHVEVADALAYVVMTLLLLFLVFSIGFMMWTAGLDRVYKLLRARRVMGGGSGQVKDEGSMLRLLRKTDSLTEERKQLTDLKTMDDDDSSAYRSLPESGPNTHRESFTPRTSPPDSVRPGELVVSDGADMPQFVVTEIPTSAEPSPRRVRRLRRHRSDDSPPDDHSNTGSELSLMRADALGRERRSLSGASLSSIVADAPEPDPLVARASSRVGGGRPLTGSSSGPSSARRYRPGSSMEEYDDFGPGRAAASAGGGDAAAAPAATSGAKADFWDTGEYSARSGPRLYQPEARSDDEESTGSSAR